MTELFFFYSSLSHDECIIVDNKRSNHILQSATFSVKSCCLYLTSKTLFFFKKTKFEKQICYQKEMLVLWPVNVKLKQSKYIWTPALYSALTLIYIVYSSAIKRSNTFKLHFDIYFSMNTVIKHLIQLFVVYSAPPDKSQYFTWPRSLPLVFRKETEILAASKENVPIVVIHFYLDYVSIFSNMASDDRGSAARIWH